MKTKKQEQRTGSLSLSERITVMVVLVIVALLVSFSIQAQTTVKKNSIGEYESIKTDTVSYSPTPDFFTDSKQVKYRIYQTKAGKYFVFRTSSKTGKTYKVYLKLIN